MSHILSVDPNARVAARPVRAGGRTSPPVRPKHTLGTPQRRRYAAVAYVAAIGVVTAISANVGLIRLCVRGWSVLSAAAAGLTHRDGMALAGAALTCGLLMNALVSSPADGHWELGLR